MARPGPGLAVRRDADEGRPPAGDEGAQRLEVRARRASAPTGRRRRPRSPSRSTARCWPASPRRRRRGRPRRSRPTTTPPRSRSPRSSSGSSATTTSSWSRSGRTAPRRRRRPPRPRPRSRSRSHVQLRLLAPFLPYVTEEVWSWWQDGLDPPAPGRPPPSSATAAAADPAMLDAVARRWSASAARSRRPRSRCAPSSRRADGAPVPPAALPWPSRPRTTSRPPARSSATSTFTPTDATVITVDAEIAPQPEA